MKPTPAYTWLRACAASAAALASAQVAGAMLPVLRDDAFARPTAWLAGLHFGAACTALRDGFLLTTPGREPLLVTTACSGFDFFSLLLGITVLALAVRRGTTGPWRWTGWLAGAYALGILANAARVVATAHVDLVAAAVMPPSTLNAMHRAAGMAVFLPVLMFAYMIIERRGLHELCRQPV